MIVDGSRYTVESRPQINSPSDGSKQDGTSATGFSSFLFLILSIPVPGQNIGNSNEGQTPGLNSATQPGDSTLPPASVKGEGGAVSGASGVQAETQQATPDLDVPITTDSAQSVLGTSPDASLPVEINAPLNSVPGKRLYSASGNHEISDSRGAGQSPAITHFVTSLGLADNSLVADTHAEQSDRPNGVFQPIIGDNKQASPVQPPSCKVNFEQTASVGEAAQEDVAMTNRSDVVNKPTQAAHPRNPQAGLDPKQTKPILAMDSPAGATSKAPAAAPVEIRRESEGPWIKESAPEATAAPSNVNNFDADRPRDHLQSSLNSKEEQKFYVGSSPGTKAFNGEFNNLTGDKTSHTTPELNRFSAQRPNETVAFIVRPTDLLEPMSAAVDAPATSWHPVVERVTKEIVGRVKLNQQDAMIQLDPPELGKIKIDLRVDGDKLQARILTEGHESQSLIENHLGELRQALQANQLDLVDVRVQSWHGASGDPMQSFRQQHQQQTSGGQEWNWAAGDRVDGDTTEAQVTQVLRHDKGRVSMWA